MIKIRCFIIFIGLFLGACQQDSQKSWHYSRDASLADNGQLLCFIGDPGTGNKAQYAVAKALEAADCDQIRVLGDIVYPSGIENENDPLLEVAFFKPYDFYFKKDTPFYLILGNHDYKKNKSVEKSWMKIAEKNSDVFFPNNYYSEKWNDVCFFSIDTTWYDKLYFLHKRSTQTNWLRDALISQKASCSFSVVLGHHPLISSGSHDDSTWLQSLFLEDEVFGKVDLFISGHEHHLADEGSLNSTRQLISGAAGKLYPEEELLDNQYYVDRKFGFLTLQFQRDKGVIVASYDFYTVHFDDDGQLVEVNKSWSNSIRGKGIRL